MQARKLHIEFLRIAAAFLVIVNHTNSEIFTSIAPSATWFVSMAYFFICKVAVPLFLMVMGAMLLDKQDTPRKSIQRFARIFVVFLLGSAMYYIYHGKESQTALSALEFFQQLFSGEPFTTAYWYFNLYLALLCILPILQTWAKAMSKRQLQWLLVLSLGVLGSVPLYNTLTTGPKINLLSGNGLIGPYFGMVFAGYYMEHHMQITRRNAYAAGALFTALIASQVFITYSLYQLDTATCYRLDDRTFLPITLSACCVYVMAKYFFETNRCPAWSEKAILAGGRLTFGIYIFSDLVLRVLRGWYVWLTGYVHVMVSMVLWEMAVFAVCGLLTAVLRRIPLLRKYL